tara:strand:- start:958 stop:1086 length:129 start_codon:yes stop_codon:yes gene_type:complete
MWDIRSPDFDDRNVIRSSKDWMSGKSSIPYFPCFIIGVLAKD